MLEADKEPMWVGRAHIAPSATCDLLEQGKNAFANVVGHAANAGEFRAKVADACVSLGFELQSLDDVETYEKRFGRMEVPDEIQTARDEVASGEPIGFGRFFAYRVD